MRIAFSKLSNFQLTVVVFVLLIAVLIVIPACVMLAIKTVEPNKIEIINASGEPIANITVYAAGSDFKTGLLNPGAQATFTYRPTESSMDMDIDFVSGRHHNLTSLVFVDGTFEQKDVARVTAKSVELTTSRRLPLHLSHKFSHTTIHSLLDSDPQPAAKKSTDAAK